MLRPESKVRARALQLLYAWDLQGQPPMRGVADGLHAIHAGRGRAWIRAEEVAGQVAAAVGDLDRRIAERVEHWRPGRIGAIERNVLRLALYELDQGETPPRVVIDEAIRLARWFAGAKAPAFVNGVLDGLARELGRL